MHNVYNIIITFNINYIMNVIIIPMSFYCQNEKSNFYMDDDENIHIIDLSSNHQFILNGDKIKNRIIQLKADGLLLFVLDEKNNIYQYQYENEKKYKYYKFIRIPVLNNFYDDPIKIPVKNNFLWCVQHTSSLYEPDTENRSTYDVETIYVIKENPCRIGIYDPWISPNNDYYVDIPPNLDIYKIDSYGEYFAMLCRDIVNKNYYIYYRRLNFDIAGYNPLKIYQFNENKDVNEYLVKSCISGCVGVDNNPEIIGSTYWDKIEIESKYNFCLFKNKLFVNNDKEIKIYDIRTKLWISELLSGIDYKIKNMKLENEELINVGTFIRSENNNILCDPTTDYECFYAEPLCCSVMKNNEKYYVLKMIVSLCDFLMCDYTYIVVDESGKKLYSDEKLKKIKKYMELL